MNEPQKKIRKLKLFLLLQLLSLLFIALIFFIGAALDVFYRVAKGGWDFSEWFLHH